MTTDLLQRFTEPDYEGSKVRVWTRAAYDALEHTSFLCEVCCARPDIEGRREHGRGCYVLDSDGGGADWFDITEVLDVLVGMEPPKEAK